MVDALLASGTARAALAARLPAGSPRHDGLLLLTLSVGGLGADPGAVTYQGEPFDPDGEIASSGSPSAPFPAGARNLESGFLIVFGLPELAASNQDMWLPWD